MFKVTFILFLCGSCLSITSGYDSFKDTGLEDDWWKKYLTTRRPYDPWNRWNWDKPTLPPADYDYLLKRDNSGIYFGIGLIIFLLLSGLFIYLKYLYDERNSRYSALSSFGNSRSSSLPTISSSVNSERLHTVLDFSNPASDASNRASGVDQPPRYDDVVRADLRGKNKFSEVKPDVPDTPPPQYEESHTVRY